MKQLLILFIITCTVFISCDNTTAPPPHDLSFDSARYNWEADTLDNSFIYDGWYCDTNKIYLIKGYSLMKYDGNTFSTLTYFPGSFSAYCLTGSDENNIYIGGIHTDANNNYRAMLQKYTNGSTSGYMLTDTSDHAEYFFTAYSRNQNEIWLSATRGKVYRFDGNNFQTYQFDTTYWYIAPFMRDESNNLYFLGRINTSGSSLFELQKFNNNAWDKIYSKVRYGGDVFFYSQNIGNEITALAANDALYNFNGIDFYVTLTIDAFLPLDNLVAGNTMNNLIFKGYDYSSRTDNLFNWDGNKWSKEFIFNSGDYTKVIHSDNEKIFIIHYNYVSNQTYLIKGKRK